MQLGSPVSPLGFCCRFELERFVASFEEQLALAALGLVEDAVRRFPGDLHAIAELPLAPEIP